MNCTNSLPLISISCITYNHESYIRECLDGFLMQKTNFPFEIIIHDDCSTDGTREIVEEYSQKYPDLIFPMFQTENQYSKGIRSMMIRFNFPRCRGKYIALCEGDDYWTDPLKLQKQVDFLEKNTDFAISCHRMKILNGNKISLTDINPKFQKEVSDILHLARVGNFVNTASVIFKRPSQSYPDWFLDLPIGDYPLLLYNAQFGKINFMKDVMGVYRIHEAGVWGQFHDSLEKISPRWIQLLEKIEDKFSPEVNKYLSQHKKNSLFDLYKSYSAKKKSVKAKEVILQLMEYDPYFLANMIINNQKKLDNTLNSNIYKVGKIISKFITMFFPFITSKKNS